MATGDSNDLTAFMQFAGLQQRADSELTLEDVLERWRETHPPEFSEEESEEIEAMVQEAIDELAAGAKCVSSEEFEREMQREFGLKPPVRPS